MATYTNRDEWAISINYENWQDFTDKNPGALGLETIEDMLQEATDIINENIGSYNVNITDVRFLSRVKRLHNRMVSRIRQIQLGQGLPGKIPMFSPNDFLIERERQRLKTIGLTLGHRVIGGVSISG